MQVGGRCRGPGGWVGGWVGVGGGGTRVGGRGLGGCVGGQCRGPGGWAARMSTDDALGEASEGAHSCVGPAADLLGSSSAASMQMASGAGQGVGEGVGSAAGGHDIGLGSMHEGRAVASSASCHEACMHTLPLCCTCCLQPLRECLLPGCLPPPTPATGHTCCLLQPLRACWRPVGALPLPACSGSGVWCSHSRWPRRWGSSWGEPAPAGCCCPLASAGATCRHPAPASWRCRPCMQPRPAAAASPTSPRSGRCGRHPPTRPHVTPPLLLLSQVYHLRRGAGHRRSLHLGTSFRWAEPQAAVGPAAFLRGPRGPPP